MQQQAVDRLEPKTAEKAIIGRIAEDLRLTPFLAEAYYKQMAEYFRLYGGVDLQDNQVAYCAVAAEETAAKSIAQCRKVPVRLTLHDPDDLKTPATVGDLRRKRAQRMCEEALDQGGLLTQEDLAVLLTTSASTIKRDLRALREQGVFVPTRGQQRDIGPGISHKVQAIDGYLRGEQLTDLSLRIRHGIDSMERYLKAFRQVALMTREGLQVSLISRSCRLSETLVGEYQRLYEQAREDPDKQRRLQDLLGDDAQLGKGGQCS